MGFFDQHPRFYRTSQTSPLPLRLNARHKAIIGGSAEQLRGARVLDIASHDGRWSFAALKAGAAHVTGIEPRAELIANACASFAEEGIDPARHDFLAGDVFDRLQGMDFDVVLCLGFYYHTLRHAELLDRIQRTGARWVVIDTEVVPPPDLDAPAAADARLVFGNPYAIQLLREPVDDQQMACSDVMTRDGHTLVGRPSRPAMAFMAAHFGYAIDRYDWPAHFARHPDDAAAMVDYHEGWRETFYLSR